LPGQMPDSDAVAYGMSYALRANNIRKVLGLMKKKQTVRHGFLGIGTRDMTPAEWKKIGTPGVVVTQVLENTPASVAGIRPGDILILVDGKPVLNGAQVTSLLGPKLGGESVTIKLIRGELKLMVRPKLRARAPLAKVKAPARNR
jgi:S1-C subfamily serine protease